MKVDILTLFPGTMSAVLHESILGRAARKGIIEINCVQIRDYTDNRQRQVDDYPYGGGWGCVMMAQPLKSCLDDVMSRSQGRKSRVIYMTPQGKTFTQETARRLVRGYDHLVLVCGHYEGVDERFIEKCVDEELSIGDFVLTGGEIAAMAVADCVCRMVPGVLADEQCYTGESHWEGLLEYPQYTRPETWEGSSVPEVLKNGNHAEIERWRRKQMIARTMDKRPDMFEKLELGEADALLLREIRRERSRMKLTLPISCRPAVPEDMGAITEIVAQARRHLKNHGIDQWQGEYPDEGVFAGDMERGECHVVTYGGEIAGFFTLTTRPEECYERLTDGKWSAAGPYCTIHRLAVHSRFRGSDMSRELMRRALELARSYGVESVRADTHKKNKSMRALLTAFGFTYRGNVLIETEPGHDPRRQGFDLLFLKEK